MNASPGVPERKLLTLAILVALGVILHRVEALLPLPSPWVKLGLANIMTLVALVFLGFREALVVTVLRIILSSIFGGTFLGPTFFLSFIGGLAAMGAMVLAYRRGGGPFSLVGVSIAGAYAHTLAITFCVYLFFIRSAAFLHILPVFFCLSLVSGLLTGAAANVLTGKLAGESVAFK
ncbi:MAG: Gx transporter family protein [Nitrospinaceae bacterium]